MADVSRRDRAQMVPIPSPLVDRSDAAVTSDDISARWSVVA